MAAEIALEFEGRPARLVAEGTPGAPLVLFLAPYPLHGGCWADLLTACAGAGLRAAAIDSPGFGGTPARGQPLAMDDLARLAAAALDALGEKSAAVAGCSMGGYAAMAFARNFPERLRALCLMNTKAGPDTAEQREAREVGARAALANGAAAVTGLLLPKLLAPGAAGRDPALWQRVQALAAGATAQGVADALRGMGARPDATPALRDCAVPALVIAGAEDLVTPRPDMAALARALPKARFEVVAGAGHYGFLERPAEYAALLTAFFSRP
jgi:3-oxoadipate enol-lactonase